MEKNDKKVKTPSFGGFKAVSGIGEIDIPEGAETLGELDITTEDHVIVEESIIEEPKVTKPKKTEKVEPTKTVKESEDSTAGEEIEEITTEEDTSNENEESSLFKVFAKDLYEKGVIDFNDEDSEFEESDKGLEKLVDKTVQNRIDKWTSSLPDEYVKFLDFVQNGGEPKQFLDVYYGNHSWEEFKVESEEAQRIAIREAYRLAGDTEEDIEEMITEWTDNGTLEKRAKPALTKLQKNEKIQKDNILNIQKEHAVKAKAAEQEYWNNFKKDLYSKDKVMGFRLSDKLKDQLWEFITVPDKKTGITAYQKAVNENAESSILFALQAMNGFDVNKLEKEVTTKVSSNLGKVLKNHTKSTKEKISNGLNGHYDDNNPFASFRNI